jgi:hypothetical protein
LDLNAGVPDSTFDEGTLNLLLPGDGRFGEERPVCATPASLVVASVEGGIRADQPAVFSIPDSLIDELNEYTEV